MSSLMHSPTVPRHTPNALAPHVISLIRERQRRIAATSRYDRYIQQAEGHLLLQGFWRNLKRQDEDDVQRLQNWIDREIGCE